MTKPPRQNPKHFPPPAGSDRAAPICRALINHLVKQQDQAGLAILHSLLLDIAIHLAGLVPPPPKTPTKTPTDEPPLAYDPGPPDWR